MVVDKTTKVESSQIVDVHDEQVIRRCLNCSRRANGSERSLLNEDFEHTTAGFCDLLAPAASKCQNRFFPNPNCQENLSHILRKEREDVAFEQRHTENLHQRLLLSPQAGAHP